METERCLVTCPLCNWGGWKTVLLHRWRDNGGIYAEWICPRCNKHHGDPNDDR